MYKLDDHVACAVAGITGEGMPCRCACVKSAETGASAPAVVSKLLSMRAADANILINSCRLAAQQYTYTYQEPIPVEQLVRALCDQKQVRSSFIHTVCALSGSSM